MIEILDTWPEEVRFMGGKVVELEETLVEMQAIEAESEEMLSIGAIDSGTVAKLRKNISEAQTMTGIMTRRFQRAVAKLDAG